MPQLGSILGLLPAEFISGFFWRTVDALLVGAVVAWLLSLGRLRDRRAARMLIAEQLCRVFGMRLVKPGSSKKPALEALPRGSLQGWASLDRLQWSVDLHRAHLSGKELRLVQALIEDLLRARANQWTQEFHLFDEYLPGAARQFLPAELRKRFLEDAKYVGWDRLLESNGSPPAG